MRLLFFKRNPHAALLLIFLFILSIHASAQQMTQTVTGKVFDAQVQYPLPGANVTVTGSDPLVGTVTDVEGNFKLQEIPVGRVSLLITYIGYEDYRLTDILVTTVEVPMLKVPMTESTKGLQEVEIKDKITKEQALNNMAILSARSISLDEAQRFAGSMEDFSRLASSFAGVTSGSIDNNEVVIRGNPAKGILWRLEGMEIPVPNHLAHAFNGGGVVSMFSPFMMANSDFISGAFPAEYGNVLSGVFDINFRTGNPDQRRYGFLIGSYGLEAAAEGPFKTGGSATYLANYRLSTFSVLKNFMPVETGLPDYTDLAFSMNFPTERSGVFSLWSLSGYGRIAREPSEPPSHRTTSWDNLGYELTYGLTASGLNHKILLGKKSLLSSSLSFSGYNHTSVSNQYESLKDISPVSDVSELNYALRLKTELNHKFGARHSNRTGILFSELWYDYDDRANSDPVVRDTFDFILHNTGNTFTFQAYSQSLLQFTENISLTAGVHFLYFGLNGNFSVDPRMSFKWQLHPRQSIGLAYGKHSRTEPLRIYLIESSVGETVTLPNKNLEISKAHHFVLAYDWSFNENLHFKVEPYVQLLYDIPVSPDSSFSMINYKTEMYLNTALDNSGTGINYGIDLTFERYMSRGYYYMLTASVYESKYKGGDGIERNTRLNQNYALNLLGGKEWQIKQNNFLSLNGRLTALGGVPYTPADQEASKAAGGVVYDLEKLYAEKWSPNYYLDISINYRINRKKVAHNFNLQAKNLTMQSEFLGYSYDYSKQCAVAEELAIILPYLSYKIEF